MKAADAVAASAREEIARTRDEDFSARIEMLIRDAEDSRLSYMKRHRMRGNITLGFGLISMTMGAMGFGWFLLMRMDIISAVLSMLAAIVLPAILHVWHASVIRDYQKNYKTTFLPRLAKALGGFQFHPNRGIGKNIISRTGILPKYHSYSAEDCFMGSYKGVKVLFSEARLMPKRKSAEPIFDGIFVLLEIPTSVIEGHTILTADRRAVKKWASTRWKKLSPLSLSTEGKDWGKFSAFSDNPESAKLLIGDRLLKELSEASEIFDNAPLSAAFFKEKFIFLMIPYSGDMFEASNIHLPVATKQHALQCKREIEQILEIIDVFDLYQPADMAKKKDNDVE